MGKRVHAKPVGDVSLKNDKGETVLLWKATIPLSDAEHEQISNRLQFEQERSGVKIILVPYSVQPEVLNAGKEAEAGDDQKEDNEDAQSGGTNENTGDNLNTSGEGNG